VSFSIRDGLLPLSAGPAQAGGWIAGAEAPFPKVKALDG